MAEDLVTKRNAKAPVWQYFGFKPNAKREPENVNKAICKLCLTKVAVSGGNTTNLHMHLHVHHKSEAAKICTAGKNRPQKPDAQVNKGCSQPENSEAAKDGAGVARRSSGHQTPQRSSRMAAQKHPDPTEEVSGREEILLPESWKKTLPKEQHLWISRALFTRDASGTLTMMKQLQLWFSPPEPQLLHLQPPLSPDAFFHSRLFLWMPCRMWAYRLLCIQPECRIRGNHLRNCGLYKTVQRVLDVRGWYFMVTEHLECPSCNRKVASWSQDVLDQLDPIHREKFPAVLTNRLSCDKEVVRLMQGQTPKNSVTALYRHLCVGHKEQWLAKSAEYLSGMEKFLVSGTGFSTVANSLPKMEPVPSPSRLLSVYVKDVLTRIGELKARVTSIYGSILKLASTKKVANKFAGGSTTDTDAWTVSVGNEFGQILMCVLTQAENEDLIPMCSGLMERYRQAGETPPQVLYVDRDCCSTLKKGSTVALFHEWDQLVVRLDVQHFMQRFAAAFTADSHQLYSIFMRRLYSCIFEWNAGDLKRLQEAKRAELQGLQRSTGLFMDPSVSSQPTAKELARHCRYRTRGVRVTEQLIEQMLKDFMGATDMGVKLVDQARMEEIWQTQRCHLLCIQDPPGIELYRKVGEVIRGGIVLPLYHCARGLTSLDSFHQHLNQFIPGKSVSALRLQAYLLEGLVQWNNTHAVATDGGRKRRDIYCSHHLERYVNHLSQKILGCNLSEDHIREYTGELIGVEYLYSQSNRVLEEDYIADPDELGGSKSDEDLEADLEIENFEDLGSDGLESSGFLELSFEPVQPVHQHEPVALQTPSSGHSSQSDPAVSSTSGPMKEEPTADMFNQGMSQEEGVVKSNGVPGYDHVINLANSLVDIRQHEFITQQKRVEIVSLWQKLQEYDKNVVSPAQHQDPVHKSTVTPCIDGQTSRLVEAVCLALSRIHTAGHTITGVRMDRWGAILWDYNSIKDVVLNSTEIMTKTKIQLYEISRRTLTHWYNVRKRTLDQMVLHQCVDHARAPLMDSEPLPHVLKKPPDSLNNKQAVHKIKVEENVSEPAGWCFQPPPVQSSPKITNVVSLFPSLEQNPADPAVGPPPPKVPRTSAW